MSRTMNKLAEAEFFLEKLQETEGKGKEFLFYLSACVNASRSITLILQKEFRSDYGDRFDIWWEEKKELLPTLPLPFEDIRDLRNRFEKEI